MKKIIGYLGGFGLGLIVMGLLNIFTASDPVDDLVVLSWGDGKYGKAFYGAEVSLDARPQSYAVLARIRLGRHNGYFHDCGQIGVVASAEEAVAKYGRVTWSAEGVSIGAGPSAYFLKRAVFEAHR